MKITTFQELISTIGTLLGVFRKCINWAKSIKDTREDTQKQKDMADEMLRVAKDLGACCLVAQQVMDYLARVIPASSSAYAYADKIAEMVQGRLSSLEDKNHDLYDANWQIIQTLVHGISDKKKELANIADGELPLPNDAEFGRIRELARQFCESHNHAAENALGRNATLVCSRCKDMSSSAIRLERLCSKMNQDLSHSITERIANAVNQA